MKTALIALLAGLLLLACAGPPPLVEDVATASPLAFTVAGVTGHRDGYHLSSQINLVGSNESDTLVLSIELAIAVPTEFVRGSWRFGDQHGPVVATYIEFFGGQGGLPLVGGRFILLETADIRSGRWRVNLPPTEVKTRRAR